MKGAPYTGKNLDAVVNIIAKAVSLSLSNKRVGSVVPLSPILRRLSESMAVGVGRRPSGSVGKIARAVADGYYNKSLFLVRGSATWNSCVAGQSQCLEYVSSVLSMRARPVKVLVPEPIVRLHPIVRLWEAPRPRLKCSELGKPSWEAVVYVPPGKRKVDLDSVCTYLASLGFYGKGLP